MFRSASYDMEWGWRNVWGESGLYAVGGKEKVEGYLRVPIPKQKCEIKKMGIKDNSA